MAQVYMYDGGDATSSAYYTCYSDMAPILDNSDKRRNIRNDSRKNSVSRANNTIQDRKFKQRIRTPYIREMFGKEHKSRR